MSSDIRESYFHDLPWYGAVAERPKADEPSAWFLVRDLDDEWNVALLRVALSYCDAKGLREVYRSRFAAINPSDVVATAAHARTKNTCLPVWEIANELVVAAYLEHVLGWQFVEHEPAGRGTRRGDWAFADLSGKEVFVEVKTIAEPPFFPSNSSGFRASQAPRLQNILARAYRQLPQDHRSTLVVVVGEDFVRAPFGIMHSDLFAALFGQFIVQFPVMSEQRGISYAGPSWREMLVGHAKRRHLGCAAALVVRGLFTPQLHFYSVHNPFAKPNAILSPSSLGDHHQFAWDANLGREIGKLDADDAWRRLSVLLNA